MSDGAEVITVAGVALDDAGHLRSDLSCLKCGYNLRTLHRDAACPECGTAVGRSIEGNRLRYCDPWWLKQIWEGLNCFGVAVVSVIAFVLAVRWLSQDGTLFWVTAFSCIAAVLGVYGFIKATKPDPSRIDRETLLNPRRVARWALLLAPLALICSITYEIATFNLYGSRDILHQLLPFVTMLLATAAPVGLLIHAAGLAGRLPNRPLQVAIWLVNGYLALTVVLMVAIRTEAFWVWLDGYMGGRAWDWQWWLEDQLPMVAIILAAMLTALLVWYWWALSRAAGYAWATWAGEK